MFLRDGLKGEDIIVVPKLLSERSKKELLSVPKSTATKKVDTLTPKKQEKVEEDNQEGEENFDDNQAAIFPSRFKEQAPFEE